MKKRFLSVALVLCMMLTLLPTAAFAEETTDYKLWVGGVRVTSDNAANVTGGGITGDSGAVTFDASTNTLTLKNADITGYYEYNSLINAGICWTDSTNNLKLVLQGDNTVTISPDSDLSTVGVCATHKGLDLSGTGSIAITLGGATSGSSRGISTVSTCSIYRCTVTTSGGRTTGSPDAYSVGIRANDVSIEDATVTASGGEVQDASKSWGIMAPKGFSALNSTVIASGNDQAIYATDGASANGSPTWAGASADGAGAASVTDLSDLPSYRYIKIALDPATLVAQWGDAGSDGSLPAIWTKGPVAQAMAFANRLSGGTAYIQLLGNVNKDNNTAWPLTLNEGKSAILDLNGKDIDRGLTEYAAAGNVINVTRGSLTLKDDSTEDVKAQGRITGGYNTILDYGGGVYVYAGNLIMLGGNITGNRSVVGHTGAGVSSRFSSFTMQGGSIHDNISSFAVGGILLEQGSFVMTGGSITGNTGDTGGVQLYNVASKNFTVGGTAVIKGNIKNDGKERNVVVSAAAPIAVSSSVPLGEGAHIAVTTTIPPKFGSPFNLTDTNSVDYSAYFFSDNSGYGIQNGTGNVVQLFRSTPDYAITLETGGVYDPADHTLGPGTDYGSTTLQAAVTAAGGASAIKNLKITAGKVTAADWAYIKSLTALERFEIAEEVTVAAMPDATDISSTFPPKIISVNIPQAISIGAYAFNMRASLTTVNLPKVTAIGRNAFFLSSLKTVDLSEAAAIGRSAFEKCSKLTTVSLPKAREIGAYAFSACPELTTVSLPEATKMGLYAFSDCTNLTTVSLPKATEIGEAAFRDCSKLKTVSLPQVTTIGSSAFNGCATLTTLKLGAAPPAVVSPAFSNTPKTDLLVLLDENGAALTGGALTDAQAAYKAVNDGNTTDALWYGWTIPDPPAAISIETGGAYYPANNTLGAGTAKGGATLQAAIIGNSGVKNLKITAGTVTVADWAYIKNLTALEHFEIADGVTVADMPDATSDAPTFPTSILSVNIPQAISIGEHAFYYRVKLTAVSLPEATAIGTKAFAVCSNLTTVSLPKVTTIGVRAFPSCTNLTTVSLPKATEIDDYAFYNCTNLTTVSLPKATTINTDAFLNCSALATLKLGATPPTAVGATAFSGTAQTNPLVLLDASGAPLTDSSLTAARTAYKAAGDGNTSDNKWYGWTVTAAEANPTKNIADSSLYFRTDSGETQYSTDNSAWKSYTGSFTITGSSVSNTAATNTVVVLSGEHNITLSGCAIGADTDTGSPVSSALSPFDIQAGTVNLTLIGSNQLYSAHEQKAGLRVAPGASLLVTAESTGTLDARSHKNNTTWGAGAGIGGNYLAASGTIAINGGEIRAESYNGAGIGGGLSGNGAVNITITGGTVFATTGTSSTGNGIGRGSYSSGEVSVVITGGSVNAPRLVYPSIGGPPKNGSGEEVELYTLTLSGVTSPTAVTALTLLDGYVYGTTGMKTDAAGKLYIYMPSGKTGAVSVAAGAKTYSGSIAGNAATLMWAVPAAPTIAAIPAQAAVMTGADLNNSLTAPAITENGFTVTAKGWQISANGSTVWQNIPANSTCTAAVNGHYLRYYVTYSDSDTKTIYSPNTVQLTVNRYAPTLVLTVTPDSPQSAGTAITLTATISGGSSEMSNQNYLNTVPVTFKDGTSTLGTATITAGTGKATYSFTPASGSHTFIAVFPGETAYNTAATSSAASYVIHDAVDPNIAAVTAAKTAAQGAGYANMTQAAATDEDAIKTALKSTAGTAIGNSNITVTINAGSYTPPTAGTAANPNGTPGSYNFTVTVSKGGLSETTDPKTIIITATPYTAIPTYNVGGSVTDSENTALSGASVKLMLGQTQVGATATTDANGVFTISGIPNGTYNLVVSKDGIVVTTIITVSNANYAAGTITLPAGRTNSVVEVKNNTPAIVVGNLDEQFNSEVTDDYKGVTAADQAVVTNGGSVEIKLIAEEKTQGSASNASYITALATTNGNTVGIYLDLSVVKTVTPDGDSPTVTTLTELPSLIEARIPLAAALQGKNSYVVYRYHGSAVDTITTTANLDGEKIALADGGATLVLTVRKFSTYAVGYNTPAATGPTGGSSASVVSNGITVEKSDNGSITVGADKKSAAITPDDGYVIADVLVDGKSVGAVEAYTVTDSGAHTITAVFVKQSALPYYMQDGVNRYIGFSVIAGTCYKYLAPDGASVAFADNPKSFIDNTIAWAKPGIDFVTERELFLGITPDRFGPNETMTRGMFVAVIGRLYERSYGSVSGTGTFTDVAPDAYYAKYVAWANENGIIRGVGKNRFAPEESITREQMATIMLNFAKLLKKADVTDVSLRYPDSAALSDWAVDGAKFCQETHVITGREDGGFAPMDKATRAEVAAVIMRFIKAIVW